MKNSCRHFHTFIQSTEVFVDLLTKEQWSNIQVQGIIFFLCLFLRGRSRDRDCRHGETPKFHNSFNLDFHLVFITYQGLWNCLQKVEKSMIFLHDFHNFPSHLGHSYQNFIVIP